MRRTADMKINEDNLEGNIREMYRMAEQGVASTEVNIELNRKNKVNGMNRNWVDQMWNQKWKVQRTAICRNEIVQGEYRRKCKRNAIHRDEIM